MPGGHYISALLREWGNKINQEIENNGFSSITILHKVMKAGPGGACIRGTFPIPGYWPRRDIQIVNDEVFALQIKYRNTIVAKWVLGMKYPEMAKILNCAYNTAKVRTEKAENILEDNVRRRLDV